MTSDPIRPATAADRPAILRLWHEGWHDAHATLVPAAVLATRKPAHFARWLGDSLDATVVACLSGAVAGFYALDGAELSRLYVARAARGGGLA